MVFKEFENFSIICLRLVFQLHCSLFRYTCRYFSSVFLTAVGPCLQLFGHTPSLDTFVCRSTIANACRSSNMILRFGFFARENLHVRDYRRRRNNKFPKSSFKSRFAQHFSEKILKPVGVRCELKICLLPNALKTQLSRQLHFTEDDDKLINQS